MPRHRNLPASSATGPTHSALNRRRLLTLAGAVGAGAVAGVSSFKGAATAAAAEPFRRKGSPRFKLSLAAYSLRHYFSFMKGKPRQPREEAKALDMVGFLDYCVKEGFDGAELTSYFFPPSADEAYFLGLKRQAFLQGLAVSGTAIGNNFTRGAGEQLEREIADALQWIDHAAVMGAPHIRFFAGTGRELDRYPERMGEAVAAMQRCAEHAAERGVFLGIENHGNLRAEQLLEIVRRVDHPWVGINLDTGNFLSEDPYADLAKCAPWAVNVQVKVAMKKPDGTKYPADFERIAQILRDSTYQGFVVLEYEEDDPYTEIPPTLGKLRAALDV